MAVTKIWDIKGRIDKAIDYVMNPSKTKNLDYDKAVEKAVSDTIDYVTEPEKTERQYYVSTMNCNSTYAKEQFETVKKQFDKEDGILAFHAYQSFADYDNVTPDVAHMIGVKLAEEIWGERFQVIISTHLDSHCLHNHFLLNSVSFVDGKKYHDCRSTYGKIRKVSDRLCREFGLSVIENPQKKGKRIYQTKAEKAGLPTRYNITRMAIDEAISKSCNLKELELYLRELGYQTQFSSRRKYWTVIPKGWEKPIRLKNLGEEYTNERILARVQENSPTVRLELFQKARNEKKQYLLLTREDRINKVGGLRGLYLKYCYQLGYLPKYNQNPVKVHYYLRDDLLKCEKFSKQVRLLGKYQINTKGDLASFISNREEKLTKLSGDRDELRKVSRRVMPDEKKEKLKLQITEITRTMKEIREEIKLGKDIEERSEELAERLEKVREDEWKKEAIQR